MIPENNMPNDSAANPAASNTDRVSEPLVERGELVDAGQNEAGEASGRPRQESVDEPAKVMRIGSMLRQLLEEVRSAELDVASRGRLRDIYELSVNELGSAVSTDLREELERIALPFSDEATPTEAELRIAQAQLVGWLEGLFHGIQATLFSQQMAARQQLEQMRQGQLPQGGQTSGERPGTYL